MTVNTTINGIPMPELTDSANIATSIQPMGNAIDSLLVARFATTTARNNAVTSPTAGMICYVTADAAYYLYNGSNWTTLYGIQKGTTTLSFTTQSAVTTGTISYPVEFVSAPLVFTTLMTGSGTTTKWDVRPFNVTAADFDIWATSGDGSTATWSNVRIDWVAIGI